MNLWKLQKYNIVKIKEIATIQKKKFESML